MIEIYEISEEAKRIDTSEEMKRNAVAVINRLAEKSQRLIINHKLIDATSHFLCGFDKMLNFQTIADELCNAQKSKSGKKRLNIPDSLLFIYKNNAQLTIAKVEEEEVVDRETMKLKKEFSSGENYFKYFFYDASVADSTNDYHEVKIADRNAKLAKYWSETFLKVERVRDDNVNTTDLIDEFKKGTVFSENLTDDEKKEISSKFEAYIMSNQTFDLNDFTRDIISGSKTLQTKHDNDEPIFKSADKLLFDTTFLLNREVIDQKYKKTIQVSQYVKINVSNNILAQKQGYVQWMNHGGQIQVVLTIDDNQVATTLQENYREYRK